MNDADSEPPSAPQSESDARHRSTRPLFWSSLARPACKLAADWIRASRCAGASSLSAAAAWPARPHSVQRGASQAQLGQTKPDRLAPRARANLFWRPFNLLAVRPAGRPASQPASRPARSARLAEIESAWPGARLDNNKSSSRRHFFFFLLLLLLLLQTRRFALLLRARLYADELVAGPSRQVAHQSPPTSPGSRRNLATKHRRGAIEWDGNQSAAQIACACEVCALQTPARGTTGRAEKSFFHPRVWSIVLGASNCFPGETLCGLGGEKFE